MEDVVNFNRQPSLTFSSVGCHHIKVMSDVKTLKMNVLATPLYNADYDGDCMSAMLAREITGRYEISVLNAIRRWIIGYGNSVPLIGAVQDSQIGTVELSTDGVIMDKWHSMTMFSNIEVGEDINFGKTEFTGREIISKILPPVNLINKKAKYYKEPFAGFINYNPKNTHVNIVRGELKSGILDKSSTGGGTAGSIFHIIANEFNASKSMEVLYNMQQLSSRYFLRKGYTVGIKDTDISDDAKEKIKAIRDQVFIRSNDIANVLKQGKLEHPIGISLEDYYEMEQLNTLQGGDDFLKVIFSDINIRENGIGKLIIHGSKGKEGNFVAINSDIGQQLIAGGRPDRHFAWGRSSPYFPRYDTNPVSLGYVASSYKEGIPPDVFAFPAGEARISLISNALKTSIAGNQNRLSVKCLESIIVNNNRSSTKFQVLVQPLYGENGIDPRKLERVKFYSILNSNEDFDKAYKPDKKFIDVSWKNYDQKKLQSLLDEEYKQVLSDRDKFRSIFIKMSESDSGGIVVIKDRYMMSVNIHRIIDNIIYSNPTTTKESIDPVLTIQKVKKLCKNIAYGFFNEMWEREERNLPKYLEDATFMLKVLIRSTLHTKLLQKKNVSNFMLDQIIREVKLKFKSSLIDYGTSCGVIAAQCVCALMTQEMLDSKHTVGLGGGPKTNSLVMIDEIFGARPTKSLKNPSMLLMTDKIYEKDKAKVQEIANHIESISFGRFIKSSMIFFEEYGKPTHPDYKHEYKMIKHYEKYSNIKKPGDLVKWCIRFKLIREELIINSMKLETIINKLSIPFRDVHIVYTPENSKHIIIRCYIRSAMIKLKDKMKMFEAVKCIMDEMISTVIRGVAGIKSTTVINVSKPEIQLDGSVKNVIVYGIDTLGTNLEEIMENPYIDHQRSHTDSIIEYCQMWGIGATRNKIIIAISEVLPNINRSHYSIYADEMTYTGEVTSIRRSGMQKREMANVALRLSFQSQTQVLEDAAINGFVSKLHGISAPLIVGDAMKTGTRYNQIIVSEKFIKENEKQVVNSVDDDL